jgi:hypothetical protein
VVAGGVGDAADSLAAALGDRRDLRRSGTDGPREHGVRVLDGEDHADQGGRPGRGDRCPVPLDPEVGTFDGELPDLQDLRLVEPLQRDRAEGGLVELDGAGRVGDRQPRAILATIRASS